VSYILDALKKSEQERAKGEMPDIKALHSNAYEPRREKHPVWPYVIGIILLLNVGVVYWVMSRPTPADDPETLSAQTTEPDTETEANSTTEPMAIAPSVAQVRQEPVKPIKKPVTKPSALSASTNDNVVFSEQPLNVSAEELRQAQNPQTNSGSVVFENSGAIVDAAELPQHIREQLPAIRFEGHVYSSVAKQSSVMINGSKMREGQNIGSDLVLQKITVEGAVFAFRGHAFKLGALQDWNSNK